MWCCHEIHEKPAALLSLLHVHSSETLHHISTSSVISPLFKIQKISFEADWCWWNFIFETQTLNYDNELKEKKGSLKLKTSLRVKSWEYDVVFQIAFCIWSDPRFVIQWLKTTWCNPLPLIRSCRPIVALNFQEVIILTMSVLFCSFLAKKCKKQKNNNPLFANQAHTCIGLGYCVCVCVCGVESRLQSGPNYNSKSFFRLF